MGFEIEIQPPKVFVTQWTDHDRGGKFAGPPVIASDIDEAEATIRFYKGLGKLHPTLRVEGEFIEGGEV